MTLRRIEVLPVTPHRSGRRERMPRLTIVRLVLIALAGLFLGGIIHIATVFLVPIQVPDRAYERVGAFGDDGQFNLLPITTAESEPLPLLDPTMEHAVCRFHLQNGPVRIEADLPAPFWSFVLFSRHGEALYSLNDRTSGTGRLTMLVLTPQQLSVLREHPPADLEDLIVIETEAEDVFALLRAFVPDEHHRDPIVTSLLSAQCRTLEG